KVRGGQRYLGSQGRCRKRHVQASWVFRSWEPGNSDEWFRKKIPENAGSRDIAGRRKKKRSSIERYKMSDLKKYIAKRKKTDKEFAKNYDKGFENFRIGVLLRQARET